MDGRPGLGAALAVMLSIATLINTVLILWLAYVVWS